MTTPPARTPLVKRALSAPPRSTPRNYGTPSRQTLVELAHVTHHALPSTPTRLSRTPARSTRRTPANRLNPKSPHGLHALQQRRGLTPARDRRKSGRGPMQSPMDIMRALSRKLAVQPDAAKQKTPLKPHPLKQIRAQGVEFYHGQGDEEEESEDEEAPRARDVVDLGAFDVSADAEEEELPPMVSKEGEEVSRRYSGALQRGRRAVSEDPFYRRRSSLRESLGLGWGSQFGGPSSGGIEEEDEGDMTRMSVGGESGMFGVDDAPELMMFDEDDPTLPLDADGQEMEFDEGEYSMFRAASPGSEPAPDPFYEPELQSDPDERGVSPDSDPGTLPIKPRRTRKLHTSAYGHTYPPLPAKVIKGIAGRFTNKRISKELLSSLEKASNLFFENAAGDLKAYAKHAGRKTIDESDAIMLMQRQRVVSEKVTVAALAETHLHRELYTEVDAEVGKVKGKRRKAKGKPRAKARK